MKKTNRSGSVLRTHIGDLSPAGMRLDETHLRLVTGGWQETTYPGSITEPGKADTARD